MRKARVQTQVGLNGGRWFTCLYVLSNMLYHGMPGALFPLPFLTARPMEPTVECVANAGRHKGGCPQLW